MNENGKLPGKFVTVFIFIVLLALVVGIGFTLMKKLGLPKVDPKAYQAVFLVNNQQYFGHLKNIGTKYPYLTDIYYIQANTANAGKTTDPNFTLLKLGGELHGPQDAMYLNWKNVLFWENLKPDSKVVEAINQEKAQRGVTQ